MACVCRWFINDLKHTFVLFFFSCYVETRLLLWFSKPVWFKSLFCLSMCHISLVLFTIVFFHSRPAVQSSEPVLWRCVQELPHESTSRQPLRFHLHKSFFACSGSRDVTCHGRRSLTGKQHKPCSTFCLDKRDSRFTNFNVLQITFHTQTHNPFKFVVPTHKLPKQGFAFKTDCITGAS